MNGAGKLVVLCRNCLHKEGGPLKEMVDKLLVTGRRNARLATAVSLHLSSLFLDCPASGLMYQAELLQLMLLDSKSSQAELQVQYL